MQEVLYTCRRQYMREAGRGYCTGGGTVHARGTVHVQNVQKRRGGGHGRAGERRGGQGRAGQGKGEEGRAGQGRAGW